jgi:hypothetical protein
LEVISAIGYRSLAEFKKERYVGFEKSRLPNGNVVYSMDWSRIDHIFYTDTSDVA